ncbi:MAG: glycosyltransferase family 39 protein [Candidatus Woesebacteria bacterium]|nr:MAG: glycosyltransferase family 39 protein [Candidatus Woesebacteria bacterium]
MVRSKFLKIFLVTFIPLTFLVTAVITLPDYGINWDEPYHFNRGQAYLNYILFGWHNYLNIPAFPKPKGDSDFVSKTGEQDISVNAKTSTIAANPSYRRSYFMSDVFNFDYIIKNDGYGHPPTNDILSSFTNFIFFHKLGVLGDIESYHLFEVMAGFTLVLIVAIFCYQEFGLLTSITASFALSSYPLFFSESHFNIKDPPQASFYGIAIILFYLGIKKNKWWLILVSAISAGLALGTKFNIVFMPFIVGPWFLVFLKKNFKKFFSNKKLIISLILYPAIIFFIFFIFWPYLWSDPINHFGQVLKFYEDVGTSSTGELTNYIYHGFNFFAPFWIAVTTPIPILFLTLVGIVSSFFQFFKLKKDVYLLLVIWFFVPITRVVVPGTTIFSGVRHILEFLPAMAILAGMGTLTIYKLAFKLQSKILIIAIFLVSFSFVIWEVARLHPNENVYFNQLVGGLNGAMEKDIPFWGYNYGNVYLQGIQYLNKNAQANAKLGLAILNMVNVPRPKLRLDIDFSNAYPSAFAHNGEYVMEMSNNFGLKKIYSYLYYETYLNPVYILKVDETPLLTIWKNDPSHLKKGFEKEIEYKPVSQSINKSVLTIDFGKEIYLTKIKIAHSSQDCDIQKGGYVMLSSDQKNWKQEPETIDYPQIPIKWLGEDNNHFVFLFVAKKARFLYLDTQMENSCILKNPIISLFGLLKFPLE